MKPLKSEKIEAERPVKANTNQHGLIIATELSIEELTLTYAEIWQSSSQKLSIEDIKCQY